MKVYWFKWAILYLLWLLFLLFWFHGEGLSGKSFFECWLTWMVFVLAVDGFVRLLERDYKADAINLGGLGVQQGESWTVTNKGWCIVRIYCGDDKYTLLPFMKRRIVR